MREKVKQEWNKRTEEQRSEWIWQAGFTKDAASRYRGKTWDELPFYIQDTLIQHEE
jgi:hypothetical protein